MHISRGHFRLHRVHPYFLLILVYTYDMNDIMLRIIKNGLEILTNINTQNTRDENSKNGGIVRHKINSAFVHS